MEATLDLIRIRPEFPILSIRPMRARPTPYRLKQNYTPLVPETSTPLYAAVYIPSPQDRLLVFPRLTEFPSKFCLIPLEKRPDRAIPAEIGRKPIKVAPPQSRSTIPFDPANSQEQSPSRSHTGEIRENIAAAAG
jgi:hypothetical protein